MDEKNISAITYCASYYLTALFIQFKSTFTTPRQLVKWLFVGTERMHDRRWRRSETEKSEYLFSFHDRPLLTSSGTWQNSLGSNDWRYSTRWLQCCKKNWCKCMYSFESILEKCVWWDRKSTLLIPWDNSLGLFTLLAS